MTLIFFGRRIEKNLKGVLARAAPATHDDQAAGSDIMKPRS